MGWMTVLNANGTEYIIRKNNEPTLEELKGYLNGGHIEVVYVLYKGKIAQMVVDEEGLLKGLPINPKATLVYHATTSHTAKQYKDHGLIDILDPYDSVIVGNAIVLEGKAMLT